MVRLTNNNDTENTPYTKARLLSAATDIFLEKGYTGAGLRQICAACGVTTGAFYFFFPNKEALFCAIVDPVIHKCMTLIPNLVEREKSDPSTARENDRLIMEFEWTHKKELLILMEKSEGSCRAHIRSEFLAMLEQYFTEFFYQELGRMPNPDIVRMLVNIRFETNLYLLKGSFTMEQTLQYNDLFACYADSGFYALLQQYKEML